MMLNVRPRFNGQGAPWPGIIMNAFDVKTLAGVGRTNGGRRRNALRGFKARLRGLRAVDVSAGSTQSNPEAVAAAEQWMRDQGYADANCYEEVLYYPTGPVFNRICSPTSEGSGFIGADILVRSDSQAYQNQVAATVASDIQSIGPNYCSGWDCEDWQTPEGQAIIQQQQEHLTQTAPGYAQYTETYGTPQQQAQQRELAAQAAGGATAADRQAGTVNTDEAQSSTDESGAGEGMFGGISTTTLLIGGVAAVALFMAMKK